MTEKSTMNLHLSLSELQVLNELSKDLDMTRTAVLRQALRLYQLVHVRTKAGERMFFDGDDKRRAELVILK